MYRAIATEVTSFAIIVSRTRVTTRTAAAGYAGRKSRTAGIVIRGSAFHNVEDRNGRHGI
jgi:hypothetical protein